MPRFQSSVFTRTVTVYSCGVLSGLTLLSEAYPGTADIIKKRTLYSVVVCLLASSQQWILGAIQLGPWERGSGKTARFLAGLT